MKEISDGITTKIAEVNQTYFDADAGYCYCHIDNDVFYFDYYKEL